MDDGSALAPHLYPVLVVDDDPMIRRFMREVLDLEGFNAAMVAGGQECLDFLAAHREPHIVLLDLLMPHPDGWDVLRHLRSHPLLRRRLAVNIHTALRNFEVLPRKTYGSVLDGMLSMPFTIEQLLETVAKLEAKLSVRLARRAARAVGGAPPDAPADTPELT